MSILKEEQITNEAVIEVAKKMIVAARTAPKGRGHNNVAFALVTGSDLETLANKMKEIDARTNENFFTRDAGNVLASAAVVILGAKINPIDLRKCDMCGFTNCEEKKKQAEIPCIFNCIDLGIAIGSAVSIAADNRVDNRVMYTIGQAALELGILGSEYMMVFGIPLSAYSKNPFFDRK